MDRILVAIDGSESAQRAAEYAARRARQSGCRVDVLHVAKDVMAWEVGALSPAESVEAQHEADAGRVLLRCAGAFEACPHVDRHVVTGDPASTILEQADKLGASEIVIGSRGLRPTAAAMLGSVAYGVLHAARVPVVVVR